MQPAYDVSLLCMWPWNDHSLTFQIAEIAIFETFKKVPPWVCACLSRGSDGKRQGIVQRRDKFVKVVVLFHLEQAKCNGHGNLLRTKLERGCLIAKVCNGLKCEFDHPVIRIDTDELLVDYAIMTFQDRLGGQRPLVKARVARDRYQDAVYQLTHHVWLEVSYMSVARWN